MVHLKRTTINPLNPSGPPIVVISRVSYQDAPSDLRRYVRHDAVERHYGSAHQEEADEENERLDEESDEEYGHNLSSDHDEDYEEEEECLMVDEGKRQEQVQLVEFGDITERNMGQEQGQEQPQERSRWVREPKSPPGQIVVVDSSKSPEVQQEEQQQHPSPTLQLRRTEAYKHVRRKDPISELIIVDSSSSHGPGVEMEDVQEMPKQKPKTPAKKVEVVEEEYDMEDTEEKPKAKPRKNALVSKAGYFYEEENIYEAPPTPKRKGGWPKGKKRGASIPRQTAFEEEAEDEAAKLKGRAQAKPKPRRKAVSKGVIEDVNSHDEMVEPQQKLKP